MEFEQQARVEAACGCCNGDGRTDGPNEAGGIVMMTCWECDGSGVKWEDTTVEALTEGAVKEAVDAERELMIQGLKGLYNDIMNSTLIPGTALSKLKAFIDSIEPSKPTAQSVIGKQLGELFDKTNLPFAASAQAIVKALDEAGLLKEVEG